MSIYTSLVSNLIFPLQERLKNHSTVTWKKRLEESQWQTPEVIAQIQITHLKRFLSKIGQEVPYYKDMFNRLNFNPEEVQSINDLARLPFLDKKLIRENTHKLKSIHAGPLAKFNTGGSSGTPLIFYLGNERVSHDVAAKWRATRWWGVDIGDPEMVIWGSPIELGAQDRMRLLRDRVFRSHLLSAFDLTENSLDHFIEEIRRVRPKMLFGYPSVISMIAKHAELKNQGMDDLGVKVIFCTSERLYDHQREQMERVFSAPVANGYGGRDAGFIAHECPEGNMHLMSEDMVVEIVDVDGKVLPDGESGEIVVTHTATSEFPFVRYRTGDVGVLSSDNCPCGRGLKILQSVEGRATDFVVAQDGTKLHGLSLIYVMRETRGVEEFKIIQHSLDKVEVELVVGPGWSQQSASRIQQGFSQRLGDAVGVILTPVDTITPEKSGKYRYVISHVV